MRSNHIGVGVNNVQAQTHNKLDDSIDMMSEQQLIEEECSHTHSGEENKVTQESSSAT